MMSIWNRGKVALLALSLAPGTGCGSGNSKVPDHSLTPGFLDTLNELLPPGRPDQIWDGPLGPHKWSTPCSFTVRRMDDGSFVMTKMTVVKEDTPGEEPCASYKASWDISGGRRGIDFVNVCPDLSIRVLGTDEATPLFEELETDIVRMWGPEQLRQIPAQPHIKGTKLN